MIKKMKKEINFPLYLKVKDFNRSTDHKLIY